jgi:hypothetical protein
MCHVQAGPRQCHRDARVLGRGAAYHARGGARIAGRFLARNPLSGDLIPGTGGVRKLRWALEGRGKRGGARVVYYYHNDAMPIFALTAYAKNERADISQADRNDFRRLTALLVERYVRRAK